MCLDWITRHFVDIVVSSALHPKVHTDKQLRELIITNLFPLAQQDAWVHHRVLDFLAVYRREQFASSREESTNLQTLLNDGCLQDAHYNWEPDFAVEYKQVVEGKPYLECILRSSRLGRVISSS